LRWIEAKFIQSIQQVVAVRFVAMEQNQQTRLEETHYPSAASPARTMASSIFASLHSFSDSDVLLAWTSLL
jgi:hypothetical protein